MKVQLGYSNSNYGEFAIIKMCYTYIMADNSSELEKSFDHKKAEVSDKIALIGELEHGRRHAIRSANSVFDGEDDNSQWGFYAVKAAQFKRLRREVQRAYFSDIKDTDWCLCKLSASLRQLAYEIDLDKDILKDIDDLVDEVWGDALNMDLSDCVACAEDKGK